MVMSHHTFFVIVTYEISGYAVDTCDVSGQRVVVLITDLGLAELTYICALGLASTNLPWKLITEAIMLWFRSRRCMLFLGVAFELHEGVTLRSRRVAPRP